MVEVEFKEPVVPMESKDPSSNPKQRKAKTVIIQDSPADLNSKETLAIEKQASILKKLQEIYLKASHIAHALSDPLIVYKLNEFDDLNKILTKIATLRAQLVLEQEIVQLYESKQLETTAFALIDGEKKAKIFRR